MAVIPLQQRFPLRAEDLAELTPYAVEFAAPTTGASRDWLMPNGLLRSQRKFGPQSVS
jgi:hypothetical protein